MKCELCNATDQSLSIADERDHISRMEFFQPCMDAVLCVNCTRNFYQAMLHTPSYQALILEEARQKALSYAVRGVADFMKVDGNGGVLTEIVQKIVKARRELNRDMLTWVKSQKEMLGNEDDSS